MATIANNHFSELAQKGRYGDTEILHFSGGERAHGNIKEKALISMYGQQGERMVKAAGAGSTNPSTGLPEYFEPVSTTLAVGSLVVGAIGGATSGAAAETQARYDQEAAQQGLEELDRTEGLLEKGYVSKKAGAQQDYRQNVESVSAQTGIAQEDLAQQTSEAIQKTGMSTSGTVGRKSSQMWNRIQSSFEKGRQGLIGDLGKKMGAIEGWYEGEKARISSERLKFQRQKDLAKEQEDAWYLGKNAGKIWEGVKKYGI
jgi:hypothetical protein